MKTPFAGTGPAPSEKLFRITAANNVPLMFTVELTYRCPLTCSHCYLPETQGAAPVRKDEELSTEEWKRVLNEMAEAGTLYLVVTGGEVEVRPDLVEILRHARSLGFDIKLFTSGILMTEASADALAELALNQVEISVYGPRETHDRITQRPGSFKKTLGAIRMLRRRGVRVMIKTPIMGPNHRDLPFLIGLAKAMGTTYRFDPSLAPRNDRGARPAEHRIGTETLMDVLYDEDLITARTIEGTYESQDDKNFLCSAGKNVGGINPFGEVFPCTQLQIPSGNVREKSFGDIWFGSKALERYRGITFEDLYACKDCEIRDYCSRCPGITHLENGDLLGPSTAACRVTLATVERLKGKIDYVPPGLRPEFLAKAAPQEEDEACGGGGCGGCGSSESDPFDYFLPKSDAHLKVETWHEREAHDA